MSRPRTLPWLVPALLAPWALLGACVEVRETAPFYGDGQVVTAAEPTGAWWVELRGRRVGSLVRFDGLDGSRNLVVRNAHGQDLGTVDSLGRAWRLRPHQEPEWLTSGTVLDGVRAILELGDEGRLVETTLADLASGG